MAAVSPKLTSLLGLVIVAAGAFTYSNRGIEDDSLESGIFDLPMAFIDSPNDAPPTTWIAPSVARNPFDSGAVAVDPDRVESTQSEPAPDLIIDAPTSSVAPTPSTPGRTSTTLTLEQTIDRRVPPGAPPVTTPAPTTSDPTAADLVTSTTTAATRTAEDVGSLPGLDG